MSTILPLGTFERVPLKDAWPTESANLTLGWLNPPPSRFCTRFASRGNLNDK